MVGTGTESDGQEVTLREVLATGLWLVRDRRSGGDMKVPGEVLQPTAPAPLRSRPRTAAVAAHEAVRGWLQATEEEALAIAESLHGPSRPFVRHPRVAAAPGCRSASS